MKGHASILTFPFRIYSEPFLPTLEGERGQTRIRLHAPFRVRKAGSPLSPEVPFEQWTAFEWHPELPRNKRLKPPTNVNTLHLGQRAFDAMRIDVWGQAPEAETRRFMVAFLRWLRFLTRQPWIGAFEPQTDPMVKATFAIDMRGRAIDTPFAYAAFQSSDGFRHALTTGEWQQAFSNVLSDQKSPIHWHLYFDAQNHQSVSNSQLAILSLAVSLEISRDTLLAPFADTSKVSEAGTHLGKPFVGTDLTMHLSENLEAACGRNLRREQPSLWQDITDLYIARHHVAHGKDPVVRQHSSVRKATKADVDVWIKAVRHTLVWLEGVGHQAS